MNAKNLVFRKNSKGEFVGSKKINDDLTVFYVIKEGRTYWELSCSSALPVTMKTGLYYECEQLHDDIDGAKNELARFLNVVIKNPNNYIPEVEKV
jgi:hypothetical protein